MISLQLSEDRQATPAAGRCCWKGLSPEQVWPLSGGLQSPGWAPEKWVKYLRQAWRAVTGQPVSRAFSAVEKQSKNFSEPGSPPEPQLSTRCPTQLWGRVIMWTLGPDSSPQPSRRLRINQPLMMELIRVPSPPFSSFSCLTHPTLAVSGCLEHCPVLCRSPLPSHMVSSFLPSLPGLLWLRPELSLACHPPHSCNRS